MGFVCQPVAAEPAALPLYACVSVCVFWRGGDPGRGADRAGGAAAVPGARVVQDWPRHRGDAELAARGERRARSHCRFVLPPIHLITDSRTYSVPLFLKRHCDRTLGERDNDDQVRKTPCRTRSWAMQPQPCIGVFRQECTGQLPYFGPS